MFRCLYTPERPKEVSLGLHVYRSVGRYLTRPPPRRCPPQLDKIKTSIPVVVCFFAGIFTNMNALQHVNVDAMIVFKTCTPLAVAAGQWLFMSYELPGARTWASMLTVVLSTMSVFATDSIITNTGEGHAGQGG